MILILTSVKNQHNLYIFHLCVTTYYLVSLNTYPSFLTYNEN
jgi:hypothetical protein